MQKKRWTLKISEGGCAEGSTRIALGNCHGALCERVQRTRWHRLQRVQPPVSVQFLVPKVETPIFIPLFRYLLLLQFEPNLYTIRRATLPHASLVAPPSPATQALLMSPLHPPSPPPTPKLLPLPPATSNASLFSFFSTQLVLYPPPLVSHFSTIFYPIASRHTQ